MPANLKAITLEESLTFLPQRAKDTHKGQLGRVLIIGGDYGMGGAVRLAGEAALRTGAGLVKVATRLAHTFAIMGNCPELMCYGIDEPLQLEPLVENASVIVLGPGLGQGDWGKAIFEYLFKADLNLPFVVDADALNLLAETKINIGINKENWILTPHPGEAARLLKTTPEKIQSDRIASIIALQQQFGGTIILKGAGSLVLGKEGPAEICHLGNPGMATAGMGDLLSGILGALIAQGLSLIDAAKLGVSLHATAGDRVAAYAGERGMKASDLMMVIHICLNPTS